MAIQDSLKTLPNSLLGGGIVSILARQSIRLNAMLAARQFQLRRTQLGQMVPLYTPPSVWVAGAIPVSVKTQEAYSYSADITQHAVESGAVLSDHVIVHPVKLDLSFEVSNWEPGFAEYADQLLTALFEERIPLDLQTHHKQIPSMVMTSLQADNSLPSWGSISYRASFTQVKFLTIESIKYPVSRVKATEKTGGPDVVHQAAAEKDNGAIVPKASGIKILISGKKGLFSK